jgi:hypothetical protein
MSLSLYDTTIGSSTKALTALLSLLKKAQEHPEAATIPETRIHEDMLPFKFQVLTVSNFAKKAVERLASRELEAWADEESTLEELIARVEKTLALLATVKPEDLQEKEQAIHWGKQLLGTCSTSQYALDYMLPNMYFHLTTAYDILRMKGLTIGKKDYIKPFVGGFLALSD